MVNCMLLRLVLERISDPFLEVDSHAEEARLFAVMIACMAFPALEAQTAA